MKNLPVYVLAVCVSCVAIDVAAQKKYFEYNNPAAVRLGKKNLSILTSKQWSVDKVVWVIKGDSSFYRGFTTLQYKRDSTFYAGYAKGQWSIVGKKKYIRHQMLNGATPHQQYAKNPLEGIYCITSIENNKVVLTKMLSSNRDLFRVVILAPSGSKTSSQSELQRPHQTNSLRPGSIEDRFTRVYQVWNDTMYFRKNLLAGRPVFNKKVFGKYDSIDNLEDKFFPNRFLPEENEIDIAGFIISGSNLTPFSDKLDKLLVNANQIYCQYLGYIDPNGDRILYMNVFFDPAPDWQTSWITRKGTDLCNFSIKINLSTFQRFDLKTFCP